MGAGAGSFEVAQANPGLCAVLENAALRFANGQVVDARRQLEEGIESDVDTKLSVLAWLALFDLLQRQGDRAAFDKLALQYVMQFERSAPAWEGDTSAASPRVVGGSVILTGKVTAAAATQIEGIRRAVSRQTHGARIDLTSVTDFDDTGARLLANALAEARRAGLGLQLLQGPKLDAALETALKGGRVAGQGAWLLSLELLQWTNDRSAFEDRAIEFAMAFELSPPSWEPSLSVAVPAKPEEPTDADLEDGFEAETLKWSGVMTGSLARSIEQARRFHAFARGGRRRHERRRTDRFRLRRRTPQSHQPDRIAEEGGSDRRRVADHPGAAAAHRRFAASLRQEAPIAAALDSAGRQRRGVF